MLVLSCEPHLAAKHTLHSRVIAVLHWMGGWRYTDTGEIRADRETRDEPFTIKTEEKDERARLYPVFTGHITGVYSGVQDNKNITDLNLNGSILRHRQSV